MKFLKNNMIIIHINIVIMQQFKINKFVKVLTNYTID